jgi:hypothetical protein
MALKPLQYDEYRREDAIDRRAALAAAVADGPSWEGLLERAEKAYRWLRDRSTVRPASLTIVPGTPADQPPGGTPVALELDMTDNMSDTFTLVADDAKGFAVPDGPFTWAESSGGTVITLAVSADTTAVVATAVAPGTATLTVVDPTGIEGTEAVVVTPGPVASLTIEAGTPS